MARSLCAHCLRSFDESELTAVGRELLCPSCQMTAERIATTGPGTTREAPAAPKAPAAPSAEPRPSAAAPAGNPLVRLRDAAAEWARGRWWWARVPLLLLFTWSLVGHLRDPQFYGLFGGINLGIHEWGHPLFSVFGRFMELLGGTLLQCLVPLLSIFVFVRQRDFFGMAVCLGWLSTNLFGVATYVGDARSMALDIRTPGGGPAIHDWNFLLERLGWLPYDQAIATIVRVFAVAAMLGFLVPGTWLTWRMWRTRGERAPEPPTGDL